MNELMDMLFPKETWEMRYQRYCIEHERQHRARLASLNWWQCIVYVFTGRICDGL